MQLNPDGGGADSATPYKSHIPSIFLENFFTNQFSRQFNATFVKTTLQKSHWKYAKMGTRGTADKGGGFRPPPHQE